MTSSNSILQHIERKGEYKVTLENAPVSIKKEHLIVEKRAGRLCLR
jgi:hypothetical protein